MTQALIDAFNAAETWAQALTAIKNPEFSEVLFGNGGDEKYATMLTALPDDQGREQAIGAGVNEIRALFGDFETVDQIEAAVKMQIEVEHAKHVFINTINSARSADELKAVLKDQLTIVNKHRQDLIEDWSDEAAPAIAARVAELKAD